MPNTNTSATKLPRCSLWSAAKCLFDFASGETPIARRRPYENGGLIVFARAVWVALVVILAYELLAAAARVIRLMCAHNPVFLPLPLSVTEITLSLLDWLSHSATKHASLFQNVFAGSYVALYARFASQWTYLADLYNQIKSKEVDIAGAPHCEALTERTSALAAIDAGKINELQCNQAYLLAQWKCGFIEDAFTLHLAKKRLFASVIANWAKDEVTQKLLHKRESCFAKEALKIAAHSTTEP